MESKFTFIVTNDCWVGVSVCAHIYMYVPMYMSERERERDGMHK